TVCTACAEREAMRSGYRPNGALLAALLLYFIFLVTNLAGYAAVQAGSDVAATVLWISSLDSAIVLVWCAATGRLLFPPLRTVPAPAWWAAAVGLAVVTYGVASLMSALFNGIFGVPFLNSAEELWDAGYGWGTIILVYCVQPAVIEELAFRGFILAALRRFLS